MKDSTKILLGFGALWLWNSGKRLYNQLDDLRFDLAGFRFITFNSAEQYITLNIDFKIFNPYNIRLMFYAINCDLLFNGMAVGKITSNINRYIFEKSETIIPITLKLHYRDIGSEIWNHIISGGRIDDWLLQIKGSTNIQNITIPLNINFVFQDLGISGIGNIGSKSLTVKQALDKAWNAKQTGKEKSINDVIFFGVGNEHYIYKDMVDKFFDETHIVPYLNKRNNSAFVSFKFKESLKDFIEWLYEKDGYLIVM